MDNVKSARIVRNLCIIRRVLFKHYNKIASGMMHDMRNIDAYPEYMSTDILEQLKSDGLEIWHANWTINQYLTINEQISKSAQNYPTSSKTSSSDAPFLMN